MWLLEGFGLQQQYEDWPSILHDPTPLEPMAAHIPPHTFYVQPFTSAQPRRSWCPAASWPPGIAVAKSAVMSSRTARGRRRRKVFFLEHIASGAMYEASRSFGTGIV